MKKIFVPVFVIALFFCSVVEVSAQSSDIHSGWLWPVNGYHTISSNYGWRNLDGKSSTGHDGNVNGNGREDLHYGIDISGSGISGKPVLASKSGYVFKTGFDSSMGNYVRIDHGDGVYSVYMHMSSISSNITSASDSNRISVSQGDTIGYVGNTGSSTGPHLHFQVYLTYPYKHSYNAINTMPTNSEIKINNVYDLPSGWDSDKTTYVFTPQDQIEPPDSPQNITGDKKIYSTSENITFRWDAVNGATDYWVYLWKDDVELYGLDVGTNTYHVSAPLSAGNYKLIVRAGNSAGYSNGGEPFCFTVLDETPVSVDVSGACTIQEGTYTLAPACAPESRLDIEARSTENEANVSIYSAHGGENQKFKIESVGEPYYKIVANCSGKVLDVYGGYTYSQTNVQQFQYRDTISQKWIFVDAGEGYYYICPANNTNLCLDVLWGGSDNGTNVQVYVRNGTNAQKWKLIPQMSLDAIEISDSDVSFDLQSGSSGSATAVIAYYTSTGQLLQCDTQEITLESGTKTIDTTPPTGYATLKIFLLGESNLPLCEAYTQSGMGE